MSKGIVVIALFAGLVVHAQDRRDEPGRAPEHPAEPGRTSRSQPSRFEPHPPGRSPRPAPVQSHPVRILQPRVVSHGHGEWRHWEHPAFPRPLYYWDWSIVRTVTCVAEDSYGDQYPVTESATPGFGLQNMTSVEDDALDRCYAQSGQDPSCALVSCSHG